jgi:hypothetical protein
MTLDTIFTVKNEHLQRLNPDEAVWFFADLLTAEIRRLGLPVTSVNISSRTNVPGGGVDAAIDAEVPKTAGWPRRAGRCFKSRQGTSRLGSQQ